MTEKLRWGIIGTGNIAKQFARGLKAVSDAELVAVGSRNQESADKFGDMFDVPRRHPSYEALASDAGVDAVYISTPHTYHMENTLLCLDHRKAVLCEKPFAINAQQAETMINAAREKKIFLMEAMWTRFFPLMYKVRELLAQGVIGDVRMLEVDFGFRTNFNPEGRLFKPELGGGALLDVGIYPVSLAWMVLGKPSKIVSAADMGKTGVDEQAAMLFSYDGGQIAILSTATRTNTPHVAVINGTEGRITIHSPWWQPTKMRLEIYGKETSEIEMPIKGNGYNYEAMAVADYMRAGKLESDIIPLDETLAIIRTLDEIRAQWGLTYPMEA